MYNILERHIFQNENLCKSFIYIIYKYDIYKIMYKCKQVIILLSFCCNVHPTQTLPNYSNKFSNKKTKTISNDLNVL